MRMSIGFVRKTYMVIGPERKEFNCIVMHNFEKKRRKVF